MDNDAAKEIFNELFSHLERLEAQSEALLQFMKEKKRVTEKQLEPYLEKAGNASNVKWRAARVRIERLLSPPAGEDKKENTAAFKKDEAQPGASTEKPSSQAESTQSETANLPREKPVETRQATPAHNQSPAPAAAQPSATDQQQSENRQAGAWPQGKPNADEHQDAAAQDELKVAEAGKQASPAQKEQTSSGSEEAA